VRILRRMHRGSVWLRGAGIAALATVGVAAGCEAPTEVTLVLTTNVSCATLKTQGTTITVGSADEIEDKAPVAVTDNCVASASGVNTIGTFVVVPSHGRSDAFAVRVVTGVDRTASECAQGGGQAPDYTGCIVARRDLAFVPHTPLTLPIVMRQDCVNIPCIAQGSEQETCVDGTCVSATITDPARCGGAGCSELTLLDGGAGTGGPDAVASDGQPEDDSGADSPIDLDGPAVDAPAADGAREDATTTDARAEGDSAIVDAHPGADAPGQDASPPDAPSQETSAPVDASILGSCVAAGTSAGVTCGSATCAKGDVCCVAQPAAGSPTYACTAPAGCDTSATGGTEYSSLGCRDVGDCAEGNVCCLVAPVGVGNGFTTTCKTTCVDTFSMVQACRNTCECGGSVVCDVASPTCAPLSIGTCGGTCP
jgi:hypothetical protein